MIPDLVKGTIETLLVPIEDDLENFATLAGSNPLFDVKTRQGTSMITDATVTFDGGEPLLARCLVNTNVPILWPAGKYFLYIKFTSVPDAPILGPLEFHVNP
jgi:hypothetical protein